MKLIFLLSFLTGICSAVEHGSYSSFQKPRSPVAESSPPKFRGRRLVRRPYIKYDSAAAKEYPIFITARQEEGSELTFRPLRNEAQVEISTKRSPLFRRPVIEVDPRTPLPYGEAFIRVPYEAKVTKRPNRRRRPSRPSIQRRPTEFKPLRPTRPLAAFQRQDERILEVEYPSYIPGAYAPAYENYIPILRFRHDMNPGTGEYDVEFETGNGIYQKETGFTKRVDVYNPTTGRLHGKAANVKTGTVSWTSPEGIPFSFSYIADENGYRPTPIVQSLSPKSLASNPGNRVPKVLIPYN